MLRAPTRGFVSLFLALVAGHAQDITAATTFEGKTITAVRYQPPTQPVMRPDLARLVSFQPGTALSLAEVRDTIKRLYGTGAYSNIEIEAVPEGNGVALVIRTDEQFFIGPVEVQGKLNTPPNRGQIQNATR